MSDEQAPAAMDPKRFWDIIACIATFPQKPASTHH